VKPPPEAIAALMAGTHADPFALLGPHEGPQDTHARALLHGAEEAEAFSLKGARLGRLTRIDGPLFEGRVKGKPKPLRYRCRGQGQE
jgi:1,4-alpha-glucan branching enzyme